MISADTFKFIAYDLSRQLRPNTVHLLVVPDALWGHYVYENLKFWLKKASPEQEALTAEQGKAFAAAQTSRAAFQLSTAAGDYPIYWFSDWETLPYDQYTPHPDLISERLRVLAELPTCPQGIVVVSAAALSQRLCPQTHLDKYGIHVRTGDHLPRQQFIQRLLQAGYQHNALIKEKGEYAARGSLLDIFPMGAQAPIRLEWFDDEIEHIRTFDLQTQFTLSKLRQISILPSHELDLSDAGRVCFRQSARRLLGDKVEKSGVYESISAGRTPQGLEYYLPLFFDETATLFDYLPPHTMRIEMPLPVAELKQHADYCRKRYARLHSMREHALLAPEQLWQSEEETIAALSALPALALRTHAKAIVFSGKSDERQAQWQEQIARDQPMCLHFAGNGLREQEFERLQKAHLPAVLVEHWQANDAAAAQRQLIVSPLQYSFAAEGCLHLAESDTHSGSHLPNLRENKQKNAGELIQSLQDLSIGAPVVHIDHGVGRYLGLERFGDEELIAIEYAKNAKLFVAVGDVDLISKYSGSAPENAPLHELGGKVWQQIKRKIKQNVNDTAAELLAVYAAREAAQGRSIAIDTAAMQQLADSFIYEETPDQLAAIDAVLEDLARERPMDRIICGDVGFGKTEVAIRAAYAAVLAGQQVVLIAPTTLLADQHYHHFADRFADTALTIDSISRFKSTAEQKAALAALKEGRTDIIIGTHRLLQSDVAFARLGLVIIDEEQRFGVRHKEKLKSLRADVNLLTLTATPIPRTLNLALTGLRDLSIIATPPGGRQSVQTIISDWDLATIEEACERELARGGQIFFLHNDVASIERIARSLQELLPESRIAIAHGQMRERELENVMQAFYNRHYDILVATTIIESGIDIPNTNTIIINHADRLGLAQLHQLRGRVGRSHHQAYAYLITPPLSTLNKDAQRRLDAFTTLDSLGAGFLLASQDLEIRGAGEILGDEQSGQIQQIGMSYYLDLLDRATAALKAGQSLSIEDDEDSRKAEIELDEPALLPADYVRDPQERLSIYQQLARAKDDAGIAAVEMTLIDRFGRLPPAAKYLIQRSRLKHRALSIGIERIAFEGQKIAIAFRQEAAINPDRLFAKMQSAPHIYRMTGPSSLTLQDGSSLNLGERLQHIEQFIDDISLKPKHVSPA